MLRHHPLTLGIVAAMLHTAALAETADPRAQLIEQGHFWQAADKPERAAEVWKKLLLLDPRQPDALYGLGAIELKAKHTAAAQDYLAKLKAIQPMPREALQLEQDITLATPENQQRLEEARRLVDAGEREKAVPLYRQIFAGRQPQGLLAREYYNNLGFTDGNWNEAREGLERLVRERPGDSVTALFLAKHLARREDTRVDGIRALQKLTQREDIAGDADESWKLALTWLGAPNAAQATLFKDFLKAHPGDPDIQALLDKGRAQAKRGSAVAWQRDPALDRGLKALQAGDKVTAERELQARLKAAPNDPDALGGLGVLRQQQGRLEDAEALLTKATAQKGGGAWKAALDDVRFWSLLKRAGDLRAKGETLQARSLVEQAVRLKPKDPAAQSALADLQAQSGQLEAAEQGYRAILQRSPDSADARRGLIDVLTRRGKTDEALSLIGNLPPSEQARVGGLGHLRAQQAMQRAKVAEQRGDPQGMREALEEALRNDPDDAWTRFALARVYVSMGAVDEARSLVDGLLVSQPGDPDALYTSALLSVQLGELEKARTSLARIPARSRTAEMERLSRDVEFSLQLQQISELSKKGRKQDAQGLLARTEPLAEGRADRLAALAMAYADAGDSSRALAMMRDLLARSQRPDPMLTLQYAGVLLRTGQDVEVAAILRDLQNQPLGSAERKQYDDLLFLYRVRQAEHLRERGDLVSAYDTLSPALTQRPQDGLALSALARMYAASGDPGKALDIYKPLLKRQPDDAQLQVGAAEMAAQVHDTATASDALGRAVALAPQDAEVLTSAARIYRSLGRTAEAEQLLRRVVGQERRSASAPAVAQGLSGPVAGNPFVGLPGQRGQAYAEAARIPPPVGSGGGSDDATVPAGWTPPVTVAPVIPAPVQAGQPVPRPDPLPQPAATNAYAWQRPVTPQGAADNPFLPRSSGLSPAAKALDEVLQQRSGFVAQGFNVRSNDSESGMGKLTVVDAPFEASGMVGDSRVALHVTPVSLSARAVKGDARDRFGGGPAATAASPGVSVGDQKDSGVGVSVSVEHAPSGVKADIGTTPQGFLYSTLVGGVGVERPLPGTQHVYWGLDVERRAVTDSLLSFAGTRDARTGQKWGGVTANGGRAQVSYDDGKVGAYGYGSLHRLVGNHVEDNTRAELGAGTYWYLQHRDDDQLTVGLSATGIGYDKNLDFYTYGHGGYFSPQNFFAVGVPVTWAQRTDRLSYLVRGSLGVQYIQQDGADYFPGDSRLQAAASAAQGSPAKYDSKTKTGVGYSLYGAAEYQLGQSFFMGGHLGIDNAQDYRQWNGGFYLRYMFEDMSGPLALPVSPFTSPYSN